MQEHICFADVNRLIIQAVADQELIHKKSLRSVIDNLPGGDTDQITGAADLQFVHELAPKNNVAEALVTEQLHRHEPRRSARVRFYMDHVSDVL
ncbi:hypothetical protein Tcan_10487 [Toxocara canis]|uniref:Uncharacterized protein n=1 Tax=Toxocara canis TaxID=6265 RepID=A0A0B2V6G6_TOXCA|nr:hypothetical protein Tcan_10487 [Toxocara canis]